MPSEDSALVSAVRKHFILEMGCVIFNRAMHRIQAEIRHRVNDNTGTVCSKAIAAEYFMKDVSALEVKLYFVLQHANQPCISD